MDSKMINLESFRAIGVRREINCENGNNHVDIPIMWDELNEDGTTEEIAVLSDGVIEGLLGICIGKTESTIDYWIATTSNKENDKFENIEVPATKWMIFKVDNPMKENIPQVWQYIFTEWFVQNDYKHADAPNMEVYKYCDNELICEVWIPIW